MRHITAIFLWSVSMAYLAFVPSQSDFIHIIIPFSIAFGAYAVIYTSPRLTSLNTLLIVAVFIRLILVFSFPHLSDDVYRFIWDGRVMHAGYSPYSHLPVDLVNVHPSLVRGLFNELNSQAYYSVYPPLAQATFYLASLFQSASFLSEVIVMKILLLGCEIGTIALIIRLLKRWNLPVHHVLIYAFNPLIVIEIMGNLHYESMMIFFLLMAVWMLHNQRIIAGALFFALSVGAKLLTLMFVPALVISLAKRYRWQFVIWSALFGGLLFFPMFWDLGISVNFGTSLDLYMRNFEFNGGIYYILRWIGFQIYGYNLIHIIGPWMAITVFAVIIYLSIRYTDRQKMTNIWQILLMSFMIYMLLSMTLHPWYTILPLALCGLTSYRFPIIWTYLIGWTYINYAGAAYQENLWIVSVEYAIIFGYILYEYKKYGTASLYQAHSS